MHGALFRGRLARAAHQSFPDGLNHLSVVLLDYPSAFSRERA
jgi:hypothetical protein